MRGSLKKRSKGSWSIVIDVGYVADPATGKRTRKQKWHTHRGTRKQAEALLADLLKEIKDGEYVDPSTLTLGDWLRQWLAASKVHWRASTSTRYSGIIEDALAPSTLGKMLLQEVRATHIETYYAAATVSSSTLTLHRAILQQALKKAKRDGLVRANVALDAEKPKGAKHKSDDAQRHCWTAGEARTFLAAAHARGIQPAALYTLALDSGARKGELLGLLWDHLDLDAGKMQIVQQLLQPGPEPVFGPPKTGKPRTLSLSSATIALLRRHRQRQNELKMANRTTYHDHGLVFAKEYSDLQRRPTALGDPLQKNNIGEREYAQLIKASGVRKIKFHGLRHSCATLLLQARTPVHVVSERLGHANVTMTLQVYAHVLPDMQTEAAATLGGLLHVAENAR